MIWFYERFFHGVRFAAWRDLRYCKGVDDVDWISEIVGKVMSFCMTLVSEIWAHEH